MLKICSLKSGLTKISHGSSDSQPLAVAHVRAWGRRGTSPSHSFCFLTLMPVFSPPLSKHSFWRARALPHFAALHAYHSPLSFYLFLNNNRQKTSGNLLCSLSHASLSLTLSRTLYAYTGAWKYFLTKTKLSQKKTIKTIIVKKNNNAALFPRA